MPSSSSTYRLDALHLEHVLANLKREHEKAKISSFQRVSFLMLQIAAYAVPLAFLVIWLIIDTPFQETAFGWMTCVGAVVVLGIAAISVLVLVPMNLPLVRTIVRQARLDRQVSQLVPGAGEAIVRPRRTPSQERWMKVLASLLLVLVAASMVLAGMGGHTKRKLLVALIIFGGPAFFILSKKKLPVLALRVGLWVLAALMVAGLILAFVLREEFGLFGFLAVFVVILLPALVLASNRYLSRLRDRLTLLGDIERLRDSLSRHRREAETAREGFVELPSAEAEQLAAVERSFIRRQRVAAIESARQGTGSGRTIFKTLAARSQIEALARPTRLLVESQLEELSFEPQPEGAAESAAAGAWRLAVPGTSVEIVYEVADELRQVRILSVDAPQGEGARTDTAEGGSDG